MEQPDRPETTDFRSQSLKTSMRPMLTPKGLGSRETPTTPKGPRSLESDRPGAARPAGDGRPEDRRLQGQSRITLTRTKSIQRDCARGRPRPTPNPQGRTRRTRRPERTIAIGCHGRRTYTYTLECQAYFCNYPDPFYFSAVSFHFSFLPHLFNFFFPQIFNFHFSFKTKANTSKAKAIKGTSKPTFSTGELPSWRPMAKSRKASREIVPCLATDFHFSCKQTNNFFLSTN